MPKGIGDDLVRDFNQQKAVCQCAAVKVHPSLAAVLPFYAGFFDKPVGYLINPGYPGKRGLGAQENEGIPIIHFWAFIPYIFIYRIAHFRQERKDNRIPGFLLVEPYLLPFPVNL